MTRLWLIRHGPTHARTMVGWTDLPADLSDTATLTRLEAALPQAPIVSSDLIRARETATVVQGTRTRLPDHSGLREFNFGAWDDRPFDAIDSPALRQFFDDPGAQRAPGGESWDDVAARSTAALAEMAAGPDLIVVAHMGVILTQWARATGKRPFEALAQKVDPLGLTRIDLTAEGPVAIFANRRFDRTETGGESPR